jgi:general secretion pathway protein C
VLSRLYQKATTLTQTQLNRWLLIALLILLVAGLGQQVWSAFNTLGYQADTPRSNPTSANSNPVNYKVSDITSSQLFGQVAGQATSTANIPVTRLQLKLRGAFTSSQPSLASAIIEGPDGETRSYKVNSKLYGQAELQQVFADRVVLSRNGQLETLYFPTAETLANNSSSNNAGQTNIGGYDIPDDIRSLVQDNMSGQEIQQAARELSSSAMTPEQRKALIRKRLQDLRNRANQKK